MNFGQRRWQAVLLVMIAVMVASGLVTVGSLVSNRQASPPQGHSEETPSTKQVNPGSIRSISPGLDPGWRSPRANPANTNYLDTTGPTSPITTRWTLTLDNKHSNSIKTRPIVANGTVYIVAKHKKNVKLYAVDAWTGEKRWSAKWGHIESVTVYRDTVYIGNQNTGVAALNAATGEKRWLFRTSRNVRSLTVANRTLYVTTQGNKLYALRALTGKEYWKSDALSAPAVANGTVYVTGGGGSFVAMDAQTGAERWRTQLDNKSYKISAPAVANGLVYVTNNNDKRGILYALDAATGTQKWSYQGSGGVRLPAVVNQTAIFGVKNGTQAVNTKTGETRWQINSPSGTPAVANGMAYYNTNYGVYALDPPTGEKKAQFRFGQKKASASWQFGGDGLAVLNGSLYTGVGINHQAFGTFDTLKLYALGTPEFTYTNLSVTPRNVDRGESVTATVTVTNTGTGPGAFNATLAVDDDVMNSTTGQLNAGASRTVTFTHVFDEDGAYTVGINGLTRNIGVGAATPAPTPTPTQTLTPTAPKTSTGGEETRSVTVTTESTPGFGVSLGVAAVALVAGLVGLRKRR